MSNEVVNITLAQMNADFAALQVLKSRAGRLSAEDLAELLCIWERTKHALAAVQAWADATAVIQKAKA